MWDYVVVRGGSGGATVAARLSEEPDVRVLLLEKGGEADKCPVYELYLYHLAQDDGHLSEVYTECKEGTRLCGGCKKEAAGLLVEMLQGVQERRDETAHLVDGIVAHD